MATNTSPIEDEVAGTCPGTRKGHFAGPLPEITVPIQLTPVRKWSALKVQADGTSQEHPEVCLHEEVKPPQIATSGFRKETTLSKALTLGQGRAMRNLKSRLRRGVVQTFNLARHVLGIFTHRWWCWEVAALFVGCISMMAVLIILLKADGTPLGDWAFPIQPNSMVSVFMTVSKSALLVSIAECISQAKWMQFHMLPRRLVKLQEYDEASRGPWGSAQLLLNLRSASRIALAGAILTISSLALDPFTQQILAFPSRHVLVSSGIARLATTQSLDYYDQVTMQGSLLSGIYLPSNSPRTFNCTTSSCQWPEPVTSLGVCSACRNITTAANVTCEAQPGALQPTINDSWTFTTTNCSYTVNDNITIQAYLQTLSLPAQNGRHAEYASQYTGFKLISPAPALGLGELISANTRWISTSLSYSTFFDKDQRDMPFLSLEHLQPDLWACGIYWCGQVYNDISVIKGSLTSSTPSSTYNLDLLVGQDGSGEFVQTDKGRSGVLTVSDDSKQPFPGNTTFTVSQSAHLKLTGFLDKLLNLTESAGNDAFSVFPDEDTGLDGFTKALYKTKNISDTFVQIAKSMTEQVRTSISSQFALGLALDDETYVQVRWVWMILPLAVLVFSITLLIITIVTNKKRGTKIWKSSTIALLVHSLQGWRAEDLHLDTLEEMTQFAQDSKAKLEKDGALGYRFGRVSSCESIIVNA